MTPRLARRLCALALCAALPAQAAQVARIDVRGLDEAMAANVRQALSLQQATTREVSGRRLAALLRLTEAETREALEPFGYYTPAIDVARSGPRDAVVVIITVDPGQPVRVRGFNVAIEGEGGEDRYLREELDAFRPRPGAVFEHAPYEAGKTRISRRLAERGYFDAELARHRVEVTRAANAADIDLVWNSGARYDMGAVTFTQTPQVVRPQLLDKLVYWEEGSYYHAGKLDRLRESLQRLDYFGRIQIDPQPGAATDHRVPVEVTLTPAKRSIYTAGLSYGTDSGAGVRLGVERRYLNSRGHKALAQLDYAQQRKTLTLQYRIPAFAWLDGWYTASLQAADEQDDYIDTRRVEFVASRSGEVNRHLTVTASLHALRERWAYVETARATPDYRYATYNFPALRADYVDVDDRLFPRAGIAGRLLLRGAPAAFGGDAGFAQLHARASWFHGLGARDRLILRGELGHTFTGALVDLPPSLRFFAGGDGSIRGYNRNEVGPRLGRYALGAKNVVTASAELEHYFDDAWGMAAFVDSGSAFDGRVPDWHTGVGVGLRWRSPVGPVRVDVARGLDEPDSRFTVHLAIGAEL
ncbi:MAG TPA: autotransporter assembly complex family protein [Xanthomonadaceae bacterium]|nr:autotransporter assembly complex family protein [Xanthomonadaceae bacterium]